MTLNLKKRWLFSRRRNVVKDSAFVSKLFQIRGPTTRKARLATVDSVTGVYAALDQSALKFKTLSFCMVRRSYRMFQICEDQSINQSSVHKSLNHAIISSTDAGHRTPDTGRVKVILYSVQCHVLH